MATSINGYLTHRALKRLRVTSCWLTGVKTPSFVACLQAPRIANRSVVPYQSASFVEPVVTKVTLATMQPHGVHYPLARVYGSISKIFSSECCFHAYIYEAFTVCSVMWMKFKVILKKQSRSMKMHLTKIVSAAALIILSSTPVFSHAAGQWGPYSYMPPPIPRPMAPPMRPMYEFPHRYGPTARGMRGMYARPYQGGRTSGKVYRQPYPMASKPSTYTGSAATYARPAVTETSENSGVKEQMEISLPDTAEINLSRVGSGTLLTDASGMTLYTYTQDRSGQSNCTGGCSKIWPPLTADPDASPTGEFSLVQRSDGSVQWAYKNRPLYTWVSDQKPGDTTGDGVGGTWKVARP